MPPLPLPRASIAAVMMFTLTAASAAALYGRVTPHLVTSQGLVAFPEDQGALLVAAIASTGVWLAAWRNHNAIQAMLQVMLACLALLSLNEVAELGAAWKTPRPLLYWYQVAFALMVVAPLVARRLVRTRSGRGPTRNRRMRTCEAVAFAFLNLVLVLVGFLIQLLAAALLDNAMKY